MLLKEDHQASPLLRHLSAQQTTLRQPPGPDISGRQDADREQP